MRCLYIYNDGQQCPMPAMEAQEFCDSHLPLPDHEEPVRLPLFFRFVRRLGAVALLALFLMQLYIRLRMLYQGD